MDTSPIRLTCEQNILDFYAAFSASDFDTMQRMMHPDCVLDFPGSSFPNHVEGREAITIAAFWPKGTPCTDFSQCDAVVARLATYATPEALARLEQLT